MHSRRSRWWRGISLRDRVALTLGASLLLLALWFELVWVWALVLGILGAVTVGIAWLRDFVKPRAFPPEDRPDDSV